MNFGFFVFTALLISMICGAIYLFKQVLDNVQFSKNPKVQRAAEIAVKVAIGLFACMLVYVVFKTALILLAPLFEQMNTAFDAAVSNLFDLLDKFIPYAVLGGIAVYWYKNKHPHPAPVDDDSVELEAAEAEADELHDDLGGLVFEAVVDASENIPLKRPRDPAGIETGRDKPYRMDGIMAIHQFNVDTSGPLSMSDREFIMDDLQRHINQRGKAYPQLCRDGYAPIIRNVKDNGNFVMVEVVLYSERYKGKIKARRKARIAHKQKMANTNDKDF